VQRNASDKELKRTIPDKKSQKNIVKGKLNQRRNCNIYQAWDNKISIPNWIGKKCYHIWRTFIGISFLLFYEITYRKIMESTSHNKRHTK